MSLNLQQKDASWHMLVSWRGGYEFMAQELCDVVPGMNRRCMLNLLNSWVDSGLVCKVGRGIFRRKAQMELTPPSINKDHYYAWRVLRMAKKAITIAEIKDLTGIEGESLLPTFLSRLGVAGYIKRPETGRFKLVRDTGEYPPILEYDVKGQLILVIDRNNKQVYYEKA